MHGRCQFNICTGTGEAGRLGSGDMKGYGQFCPIAKASEILAERWTPLVLRELVCGSTRFNDIHRGIPLMSRGLLAQRLRALVDAGLVERRVSEQGHGPEYRLTEAGAELRPLIFQLGEWGARWVRSQLDREDLDASLLMWDIRRNARPERFPARRVVVAFRFIDAPRNRRFWWLISDGREIDLCALDPGYDVDLHVVAELPALTAVWTGDRSLAAEREAGRIRLEGRRELRERFGGWLGTSPFAQVRPAEGATAATQPSS